jgi:hypothetical protein
VPDGKVKLFLVKSNSNSQIQLPNSVVQPVAQLNQVIQPPTSNQISSTSQVGNPLQQNVSANEINTSTSVLDLGSLKIPTIESTDKFVIKLVCSQIRKSVI